MVEPLKNENFERTYLITRGLISISDYGNDDAGIFLPW
jgi:hypothetical protein